MVSTRPEILSQANERMVLRMLRTGGPQSRADVARSTGITAPTVSKAVSSLLESGILEEFDAPKKSRGRPAKMIRLAEEMSQVIGLVIDSRTCRLASADLVGRVQPDSTIEFRTPNSYSQLIELTVDGIKSLQARQPAITLGIGVSLPGLFDYQEGRSLSSPNVRITNGQRPGHDLSAALNTECVVLQESAALCLAERHYGLAQGINNFAMLDASTGIGMGVFIDGRLLKGSDGLAGDIGHLPVVKKKGLQCGCGRTGCLETVASDTALARIVSERIGDSVDINEIVERVKVGGLNVDSELRHVCEELSFALVTMINLFNPRTLFVHSRMFDINEAAFEQLVSATEAAAQVHTFQKCRIERARGSKQEGAIAGIIEHLTDARLSESASHFLKVL